MLRILLFPFSLLYGIIVFIRNKFYDLKILRSTEFDLPIISIGNLSAGGTGKTPHTEYLVSLLSEYYKTGTLSRGYGRKTKGFLFADENTTALDIGDEPYQIKQKFPLVTVAVGEDRVLSIPEILAEEPSLQVILLDDAYQHRPLKAGLNILLTPFDLPFYKDSLLPGGRLREQKSGAARADVIIISRSPVELDSIKKRELESSIRPYNAKANVFFSNIRYGKPYSLFNKTDATIGLENLSILLVCAIANPKALRRYLTDKGCKITALLYPDHFNFRESDLERMKTGWNSIIDERKIMLTTEKDAAKLIRYKDWFAKSEIDLWVMPIEIEFNNEDKNRFNKLIFDFLKSSGLNGQPVG